MKIMINFKGAAGVIHQQTHALTEFNVLLIHVLLIHARMHACIHPFRSSVASYKNVLVSYTDYIHICPGSTGYQIVNQEGEIHNIICI